MSSDVIMVLLLMAYLLVPTIGFVVLLISVIRWLNRH